MSSVDPLFLVLLTVLALLAGLAIGWWLGGRPVADARKEREEVEAELRALDEKFRAAITDLARATDKAARVDDLEERISERDQRIEMLRTDREVREAELAALRADAANHDKQLKQLAEAREELSRQFGEIGNKLLGEAQENFLKRAQERFSESEKTSEAKIKALLSPVGEKLKIYEESVRLMEEDRKKEYGSISRLMDDVRLGQEAVKIEANNIVNSLRSGPKTSGRWGEQQFENLLDISGLAKYTDFNSEVSINTDDGILRPDFVIRLPGDRELIVDVKCPLDAYLSASEELDEHVKKAHFQRHSAAVRGHANSLSKKAYWSQFEKAPDFVLLYIPGDNFLAAALEHDHKLWDDAAKNGVIVVGPATFFPLAKTIASMWHQDNLTDKAKEVLELGRDLHYNLSIMSDRVRKLGKDLDRATGSYNSFIKSLDGRVIMKARRFEEINLNRSDKNLGDFEAVEDSTTPLVRLASPDDNGEADKLD